MEAAVFKDRNTDFPPPKSDSQSPRPSSQNGFHSTQFGIPDIEMTAKQSSSSFEYTSLKDLLQAAGTVTSPTASSSWHEIPIRNSLVKHAAMAYLQPMSTPTTSFDDREGFSERLKEICLCCYGGEYGFFGWLCDVLSQTMEVFGELVLDRRRRRRRRGGDSEDEGEDDEDEEDKDDEKVD